LGERAGAGVRPRGLLTVSQWADRYRELQTGSNLPGRWNTDRTPYLREIMDSLSEHSPVSEVCFLKSVQVGATECLFNWIGYIMHHLRNKDMMVVLPSLELRDRSFNSRLGRMFDETPVLKGLVSDASRNKANRDDLLEYGIGARMIKSGANSSKSLRSDPIAYVICDEVDEFPAEIPGSGDPMTLIEGRQTTFSRAKTFLVSTPKVAGESRIEAAYLRSDRRRYLVPCPHCGEYQPLEWANLKYTTSQLHETGIKEHERITQVRQVWYECAHCHERIDEQAKTEMLARGYWKAQRPGITSRRGYHINALYIPAGLGPSWLDLATKWNEIHHDPVSGARRTPEPGQLMAFLNEELGEVWQDRSSSIKANELEQRKDDTPAGEIPPGVLALTLGIDTQDNWLDVSLIGWREWQDGRPAWTTLDWLQIHGDTASREPWDQLEAYINREWTNAYGRTLRPRAAAIDNRGHRGEHVKAFIQRPTLQIPVYRVQGSTRIMSEFIASSARDAERTSAGKTLRNAYGIWNIGTESVKDMIYSGLHADKELPPEERRFRFNAGLPTEYFNGLLSEVKNPKTHRYEQRRGAEFKRNEPLDGLVYAIAIGHHRDVMIGCRRARLHRDGGRSVSMTVPDARYWERVRLMLETSPADLAGSGADPKPNAAQPKRRWRH
jgi:phage terminase large subunit GpA-like protein